MNIQRLKFAAARGARIEVACLQPEEQWMRSIAEQEQLPWEEADCPAWNNQFVYRIHPDDAHLEYGPLSTAIQQIAVKWPQPSNRYHRMALQTVVIWLGQEPIADPEDWMMKCLVLAEYLADEGL